MARDAQEVTCGSTTGTFVDYIPLEGGGHSIVPFSRVVFRGSFDLDGSGVGDTADCRLKLPLPSTNVWQMDQFAVAVEGTVDYDQGVFELYYAPSTIEFGSSTQLNYVMTPTDQIDPTGTNTILNFLLGAVVVNNIGTTVAAALPNDDPYKVISFNDTSSGAEPVVWISGGNQTNITAGTMRFAVSFLGYTFEQMNKGILHAGLSSRG